MKIANDLFRRADKIGMTMRSIMKEAGVEPELAYTWKKREPNSWERWMGLIKAAGVHVPPPGTSTWDKLGGDAHQLFKQAGFQAIEISNLWMHRDALPVENYKKVLAVIKKYEKEAR